jgi:hypothetical protein
MNNFYMFMCDVCGYAREKPGICPYCEAPLSIYGRQEQHEYQVDMEEPMRQQDLQKWYL